MDLPKTFDEFVDARKQGFIRAKEFKDNGGKLAGCLCSYTPQELLDAAGVATVGLCGTSSETIPDAEKVLPKNLCPLIKSTYGFAYSEKCPYTYFSDSCFFSQFSGLIYLTKMIVDSSYIHPKQISHTLL